jgi:hypothetical protein
MIVWGFHIAFGVQDDGVSAVGELPGGVSQVRRGAASGSGQNQNNRWDRSHSDPIPFQQ